MMTKTVDIRDNHIELADLLYMVGEGVEVILTDGATPVARLVPLQEGSTPSADGPRIAGLHSGAIWTSEDFDEPLADEFRAGVKSISTLRGAAGSLQTQQQWKEIARTAREGHVEEMTRSGYALASDFAGGGTDDQEETQQ